MNRSDFFRLVAAAPLAAIGVKIAWRERYTAVRTSPFHALSSDGQKDTQYFTIHGHDAYGRPISETLALPPDCDFVTTRHSYATLGSRIINHNQGGLH